LDWLIGIAMGLIVFVGISLAMREPPQVFHRLPPDTDPPDTRLRKESEGPHDG